MPGKTGNDDDSLASRVAAGLGRLVPSMGSTVGARVGALAQPNGDAPYLTGGRDPGNQPAGKPAGES